MKFKKYNTKDIVIFFVSFAILISSSLLLMWLVNFYIEDQEIVSSVKKIVMGGTVLLFLNIFGKLAKKGKDG